MHSYNILSFFKINKIEYSADDYDSHINSFFRFSSRYAQSASNFSDDSK